MDARTIFKALFSSDYVLANPEINEVNVFSVSTLARSAGDQLYWKQNRQVAEKREVNFFMQIGNAEHEYLQKRLPPTFTAEYKISYRIPFAWRNAPKDDVVVIGHIDAIDFTNKELHDYKTTWSSKDFMGTYKTQVGFYLHWCDLTFGDHWKAFIYKIKLSLNPKKYEDKDFDALVGEIVEEHQVYRDEAEESFRVVVARALEVARQLDDWLGEQAKALKPPG